MYENYFGLVERPFSIAPDPQYLYMSQRHKEAMAHLSYGLSQGGCFIVLTGEVGTGKTTLCRNLLMDLPDNVDVALILNANVNEQELLETVCDELKVKYAEHSSQKKLLDQIYRYLLKTFSKNRHTVLIIDEAQLLSPQVLEQVRLLTNLETNKHKLLQIILIGQPELNQLLKRNDLRQLAQRVTARYHLGALRRDEIEQYVNFRLSVAGCKQPLFSKQALNQLYKFSEGVPRKINVLADHALLAAYGNNKALVDAKTVKEAAKDVYIDLTEKKSGKFKFWWWALPLLLLLNGALWWWLLEKQDSLKPAQEQQTSVSNNNDNSPEPVREKTSKPVAVEETSEPIIDTPVENSLEPAAKQSPERVVEESPQRVVENSPELVVEDSPERTVEESSPESGVQNNKKGSVVFSDELLEPVSAENEVAPVMDAPEPETPITVTDSELGKLLETSADITGQSTAFDVLAKQWGVNLPSPLIDPLCATVGRLGLGCLSVPSWEQLISYNRPVVIVLNHKDKLHRVVLESITGTNANLLIGNQKISVPVSEVESRWANSGGMFWRPRLAQQSLKIGSQGSDVLKARVLLNKALENAKLPLLESLDSDEFDLDMSQKVFALQSRFGLTADSIIGQQTFLLINELVAADSTPQLLGR